MYTAVSYIAGTANGDLASLELCPIVYVEMYATPAQIWYSRIINWKCNYAAKVEDSVVKALTVI